MAAEVEETLKRLVGHKGVIGTVVVNKVCLDISSIVFPTQNFVDELTDMVVGRSLHQVDAGPEHDESVQLHPRQSHLPGSRHVQGARPQQRRDLHAGPDQEVPVHGCAGQRVSLHRCSK